MKLKLSKAWYEHRAKIEISCSEIAAGISIKPKLENDSPASTSKTKPKESAAGMKPKAQPTSKP
jgi:hypothetical protein